MIQISVVSGKNSGKTIRLNKFPVIIGRSPKSDVILDDDGVWDNHCEISYIPRDGFYVAPIEQANVLLNGTPVQMSRLHNGDLLILGAAKLRFWLSDVKPKNFMLREIIIWTSIIALFFLQVLLIYKIIHITG